MISDNAFSTPEIYDDRIATNSSAAPAIFTMNVILATSGRGVVTGVIGWLVVISIRVVIVSIGVVVVGIGVLVV